MNAISLFKIQSLVALTLVSLSLPALGQTKAAPVTPAKPATVSVTTPATVSSANAPEPSGTPIPGRTTLDSYQEACPNGATTAKCKELYLLAGGSSATTTDTCSTQQTRADDLQQKNSEAALSLLTSQKEMITSRRTVRDQIIAAQNAQAKATRELADTQTKLMHMRQAQEDAAGVGSKKAVTELRRKADENANAVLEATKELQAAELAVADADIAKEASCRSDADKASTGKEVAIDTARAQAKSSKTVYNWNVTSLASSDNRRAAKRKAEIQLAYILAYTGCIQGTKGSGPGLAGAIKAAESRLVQARTNHAAKLEILKTARARVDEDMMNLSDEVAAKMKQIVRDYEDGMASAAKGYADIMDQTNSTITTLSADLKEDQALNDGILKKTSENAQQLMQSMYAAMGAVQKCNADQAPKAEGDGEEGVSRFSGSVRSTRNRTPVTAPAPAAKSAR